MNANASSVAERSPVASIWIAIAWLEGLNVLGVVFVVGAALTTLDCFLCGESEPMSGAATAVFAAGWIALAAAPVLAARASGQPLWFAVGILAALPTLGAFAVGAKLFGDFAIAAVLALGAQAAVAVRPPSSNAWIVRSLVLVALYVLGTAGGGGAMDGILVIVLLIFGRKAYLPAALGVPYVRGAR